MIIIFFLTHRLKNGGHVILTHKVKLVNICSYLTNITPRMFQHSFISHIRNMFWPTISVIIR